MFINRFCFAFLVLVLSSFSNSVAASAGRTKGQFAVSPFGAATYSIPIWVPPGIGKLTPSLAFSYNSHHSYGLMGPGWELSGLSVITRCNLTYVQDGQAAPIGLSAGDGFCLDGNRLRYTGTGAPGTGISEYQTEIADFSLTSAVGTAGDGPAFFELQRDDGLVYEYGNTPDSQVRPSPTTADPYIWALNKVTDLYGNYMTFSYAQSNGAYVPISIQYSTVASSSTFPYEIDFAYTTKSATDKLSRYLVGNQLQQ